MNLLKSLAPVLLAVTLASCQAREAEVPPLAGATIGGPFALVDQNRRARTDRDFAGKYRIMYFGYTYCPDVCPVDMARLVEGYKQFAKSDPVRASRVVPIFVSVDPGRDTPAVLKTFAAAFDPRVVGLTGSAAAITATTKAYGIAYSIRREPGAPATLANDEQYLVDHSRVAYLMDPDNKPIALLSQDEKPAVIAAELDRWVR